ncbi:hypothetical protein BDV97DRAFT_386522 [Delphinella strobiligena]|nr:hypothetical protein BDV97DRAFT_386522 [Delphinella strobiligena]
MNNEQFRRLLVERTPASKVGAGDSPQPSARPSALGNKRTSFIPMTPRTVKGTSGVDFARQVAERNAANQPTKKFKGSSAPKGAKLAAGYHDRTLARKDIDDDERGARIKALEEQMKLGQLDQATFESLRDQITGGDISATHLVKGLDRKLLERIRKGEDVEGTSQAEVDEEGIDEELDRLEETEVARVEREKTKKKGEMAAPQPPSSVAGAKRTRDQILVDLKAQRKAAADARAAARPELGSQFRDISAKPAAHRPGKNIDRDEKGREFMITVDEHGNVKKKVRKVQIEDPANDAPISSEKAVKFLDEGITLPVLKEQKKAVEKEESDEEDIFADAGTDYNPLGGDEDSGDDGSDEEGQVESKPPPTAEMEAIASDSESPIRNTEVWAAMPPPPVPPSVQDKPASAVRRNYFKISAPESTTGTPPHNPFNDTNFLAAIKKASALSNLAFSMGGDEEGEGDEEDEAAKEARLRKRAAMLAGSDRDFEDMDMGFGSSRYGDEEDAEEGNSKVKLSKWKGTGAVADADDDGEGDGQGGGKGGKRKRSRKRMGNKNSAKDVLGVLERRKEGGK